VNEPTQKRALDLLRARVRFVIVSISFLIVNVIMGSAIFLTVWFAPDWAYWQFGSRGMRWYMYSAAIRWKILGGERLKPSRTAVYVSNHQSFFDIPAVMGPLPIRIHFVAKRELVKIPILGWVLVPLKMILIDRSTTEKAYASIEKAAHHIGVEGRSVLIYPEGGISKSGKLQPFKKGAFSLAIKAQVPIVPIVVHNSGELFIMKKAQSRPGVMRVEVLPEIDTTGMTEAEVETLMERTHAAMSGTLEGQGQGFRVQG
jgi:1-acyl-sn-glycerol-3-phosphate acyltransferase